MSELSAREDVRGEMVPFVFNLHPMKVGRRFSFHLWVTILGDQFHLECRGDLLIDESPRLGEEKIPCGSQRFSQNFIGARGVLA